MWTTLGLLFFASFMGSVKAEFLDVLPDFEDHEETIQSVRRPRKKVLHGDDFLYVAYR